MFEKNNKNNIIIQDIKNCSFHKNNDILLTPTGVTMISNHYSNIKLQGQMDYQDRVTSYINRKHELNIKKDYNPKIVNLYKNGIFVINHEEYKLSDFFIVYKDTNFNIKCIDERFKNDEIEYDHAVKFIDTTAFINLVNSDKAIVKENRIIIDNQDILIDIVHNWDGYIHNETKETEAIANKKMTEGDSNE